MVLIWQNTAHSELCVVGITRQANPPHNVPSVVYLHEPALTDPIHPASLTTWQKTLILHQVDEVYHLAAQTCKVASLTEPLQTFLNTGYWTCVILEAIRLSSSASRPIRFSMLLPLKFWVWAVPVSSTRTFTSSGSLPICCGQTGFMACRPVLSTSTWTVYSLR